MVVNRTDIPHIYSLYSFLNEDIDRLCIILFCNAPESSEVIASAVGNQTEFHALAHLVAEGQQSVQRTVQGRVAAHNDERRIAVLDQHLREAPHGLRTFALYEIICHLLLIQQFFDVLPSFVRPSHALLRTVDDAPTVICLILHMMQS